jgi:hypothetical protein
MLRNRHTPMVFSDYLDYSEFSDYSEYSDYSDILPPTTKEGAP